MYYDDKTRSSVEAFKRKINELGLNINVEVNWGSIILYSKDKNCSSILPFTTEDRGLSERLDKVYKEIFRLYGEYHLLKSRLELLDDDFREDETERIIDLLNGGTVRLFWRYEGKDVITVEIKRLGYWGMIALGGDLRTKRHFYKYYNEVLLRIPTLKKEYLIGKIEQLFIDCIENNITLEELYSSVGTTMLKVRDYVNERKIDG